MDILFALLLTAMVVLFSIFASSAYKRKDYYIACVWSFLVGVNLMNLVVAIIIKGL